MASWQLQEAKTHLSEVIEEARTKGPQIITRHGRERAVVLSIEEYRDMNDRREDAKPAFVDVLLGPPYLDQDDAFFKIMEDIQADRKRHLPRKVEL